MNQRPLGPEPSALPNCATSRIMPISAERHGLSHDRPKPIATACPYRSPPDCAVPHGMDTLAELRLRTNRLAGDRPPIFASLPCCRSYPPRAHRSVTQRKRTAARARDLSSHHAFLCTETSPQAGTRRSDAGARLLWSRAATAWRSPAAKASHIASAGSGTSGATSNSR